MLHTLTGAPRLTMKYATRTKIAANLRSFRKLTESTSWSLSVLPGRAHGVSVQQCRTVGCSKAGPVLVVVVRELAATCGTKRSVRTAHCMLTRSAAWRAPQHVVAMAAAIRGLPARERNTCANSRYASAKVVLQSTSKLALAPHATWRPHSRACGHYTLYGASRYEDGTLLARVVTYSETACVHGREQLEKCSWHQQLEGPLRSSNAVSGNATKWSLQKHARENPLL